MITSAESSKIMSDKCFKIEYEELLRHTIGLIKAATEEGWTEVYLNTVVIKRYEYKVLSRLASILSECGYKVSYGTGKFARDKKPSFYINWSLIESKEDFENE